VSVGGKRIPQWSPTVMDAVKGYNPATDCNGNFMEYKFQANNNCYNYACNIATNSFAQPGRLHGISVLKSGRLDVPSVRKGAELDGLTCLGNSKVYINDVVKYSRGKKGHVVALLISEPDESARWSGDYHWVRCDSKGCNFWSQKSGSGQVTNLDFTGRLIVDPTLVKWRVNQGPDKPGSTTALLVEYTFTAWMFVPYKKVEII
jgi:hypothetical protein